MYLMRSDLLYLSPCRWFASITFLWKYRFRAILTNLVFFMFLCRFVFFVSVGHQPCSLASCAGSLSTSWLLKDEYPLKVLLKVLPGAYLCRSIGRSFGFNLLSLCLVPSFSGSSFDDFGCAHLSRLQSVVCGLHWTSECAFIPGSSKS